MVRKAIVWVLFVNSIVCFLFCPFLFCFCFFGWDRWAGFFGWFGFSLFCFCLESLILAQDERWRRA